MAIVKTALLGAAGLAMAGTAWAGCDSGTICSSSKISQYESGYGSIGAVDYSTGGYGGGETVVYSSGGSYDGGLGASTVVSSYSSSSSYSSGGYGVSAPYSLDTDISHSGTVSGLSIAGLGPNEQLCPTACGSSGVVGGGKVLGCYAVCKPAPRPVTSTVLTRVVHPVYYVRYPVPYAVPVATGFGHSVHYSRYGDHAHAGGYRANCSYDYGYHGHAAGYGYGYGCR